MIVEFVNEEVINVDAEEVNDKPEPNNLIKVDFDKMPVKLSVTDAEINRLKQFKSLTIVDINDKTGYNVVDLRRKEVKKIRTALVKHAKALRAPAKAYQDRVIAEENRIVAELEAIEADLEAKQKVIDDEKVRIMIEEQKKKAEKLQARVNVFVKYTVNEINLDYVEALSDSEFEAVIADMKAAWEKAEEEKRQAAEALRLQQEENERLKKELEQQKKTAPLPPTPEQLIETAPAPASVPEAPKRELVYVPEETTVQPAEPKKSLDKRKLTLFLSEIVSIDIPVIDSIEHSYVVEIARDHLKDASIIIEQLISKL